jgi:hypothetical protein
MNKVLKEDIDRLLNEAEWDVQTIYGKVTVVTCKLKNGFTMVESSGCVDPRNYDEEIGREVCQERITNRLWELEGYMLQETLYRKGIL